MIDHATRLNDALTLFVAVERKTRYTRERLNSRLFEKSREAKKETWIYFLKNAVPFLGLCDPVLVGSDDRMMNLNDSIFQSAFLPQSLFLIKKLFPLFPARIGTAAYRRHHRSFRQRSYNL